MPQRGILWVEKNKLYSYAPLGTFCAFAQYLARSVPMARDSNMGFVSTHEMFLTEHQILNLLTLS